MENGLKHLYKIGAFLTLAVGGVSFGLWQTGNVVKFMGERAPAKVSPFFSPGPVNQTLVKMVASSRTEIVVMANTLTSKALMETIEKVVKERGVKAYFLLDQATDRGTGRYILSRKLGAVFHDTLPNANQIIIVDKRFVAIGSAKFSTKAEDTAQSVVIIDSTNTAAAFRDYFKSRADQSMVLKP